MEGHEVASGEGWGEVGGQWRQYILVCVCVCGCVCTYMRAHTIPSIVYLQHIKVPRQTQRKHTTSIYTHTQTTIHSLPLTDRMLE